MIELLIEQPALFVALTGVVSLLVGSFLNVVIWRLPLAMQREWRTECRILLEKPEVDEPEITLSKPASHCPACKHPIRFRDNIPVLSWLLLRGRCRDCGVRISARYPAVELLTAVASMIVAWQLGPTAYALAVIGLTWMLIAASGIDFDHQLLPDSMTLPGLWAGLLLAVLTISTVTATEAIIGAAAGYLSLWLVYHAFRILTGKHGMGHGDFKLLGLFGAWLGWQALPLIVLLSSAVGAAVGIVLILTGKLERGKPMPFGPYIAAAGWIAILWGERITSAYLGTLS